MNAREYMERARSAARDAERAKTQLSSIKKRGDLGNGGSIIPHIDRLKKRLAKDERIVNQAVDLIAETELYDPERQGRRVGVLREDILTLRYPYAEKWDEIAETVGLSMDHVIRIANMALDYMDEKGVFVAMT